MYYKICIIKMFKLREGNYHLRGLSKSETCKIRTNMKYRCVSVLGAKLWNSLNDDLKLLSFKKVKCKIMNDYKLR